MASVCLSILRLGRRDLAGVFTFLNGTRAGSAGAARDGRGCSAGLGARTGQRPFVSLCQ